jgi:hypothetical protein
MHEMTPARKEAAERIVRPMIDAMNEMTAEELRDAMLGLYAANEDNCSWYVTALKFQLPCMIASQAAQAGIDINKAFEEEAEVSKSKIPNNGRISDGE